MSACSFSIEANIGMATESRSIQQHTSKGKLYILAAMNQRGCLGHHLSGTWSTMDNFTQFGTLMYIIISFGFHLWKVPPTSCNQSHVRHLYQYVSHWFLDKQCSKRRLVDLQSDIQGRIRPHLSRERLGWDSSGNCECREDFIIADRG